MCVEYKLRRRISDEAKVKFIVSFVFCANNITSQLVNEDETLPRPPIALFFAVHPVVIGAIRLKSVFDHLTVLHLCIAVEDAGNLIHEHQIVLVLLPRALVGSVVIGISE